MWYMPVQGSCDAPMACELIVYKWSALHPSSTMFKQGRRGGLVVEGQTPEREVGGSILTQVAFCVLEQDTFTSQKVLVIPRKRSLLHDMTEKLLTGT